MSNKIIALSQLIRMSDDQKINAFREGYILGQPESSSGYDTQVMPFADPIDTYKREKKFGFASMPFGEPVESYKREKKFGFASSGGTISIENIDDLRNLFDQGYKITGITTLKDGKKVLSLQTSDGTTIILVLGLIALIIGAVWFYYNKWLPYEYGRKAAAAKSAGVPFRVVELER